ncbi:hypothetical protein [Pseudoduganella sp. RAF53_2]|uniref:hypothetical protein n=1 Tax=Pseudoduganella sp. RAF53_2 TaxID=3233060 RepID=UPI003F9D5D8D
MFALDHGAALEFADDAVAVEVDVHHGVPHVLLAVAVAPDLQVAQGEVGGFVRRAEGGADGILRVLAEGNAGEGGVGARGKIGGIGGRSGAAGQ